MVSQLLNFSKDIFNLDDKDYSNIRIEEDGCFNYSIWKQMVIENKLQNIKILELGTWYGYGANKLSLFLKEEKIKHEIICVDTWLGSIEHYFKNKNELKLKNGFPQFYFEFLKVVNYFNNTDTIVPFVTTTMTALNFFYESGIKFDFIIIDAQHKYFDVLNELILSIEVLSDNGYIVCDDLTWPEVSKACDDFFNFNKNKDKLEFAIANNKNQLIIRKKKRE